MRCCKINGTFSNIFIAFLHIGTIRNLSFHCNSGFIFRDFSFDHWFIELKKFCFVELNAQGFALSVGVIRSFSFLFQCNRGPHSSTSRHSNGTCSIILFSYSFFFRRCISLYGIISQRSCLIIRIQIGNSCNYVNFLLVVANESQQFWDIYMLSISEEFLKNVSLKTRKNTTG